MTPPTEGRGAEGYEHTPDAVKRVPAEISGSEISSSRDLQADSDLASGRASGNQLGRALRAEFESFDAGLGVPFEPVRQLLLVYQQHGGPMELVEGPA